MAIKKNDFSSVKKKFSTSAKYKPQRFFDLGSDFLDAVGLPGPAIGHLNMFLGHSDTGKTTALVLIIEVLRLRSRNRALRKTLISEFHESSKN